MILARGEAGVSATLVQLSRKRGEPLDSLGYKGSPKRS